MRTLKNCWACDSPDWAYKDVLGLRWCDACLESIYWNQDE